MALNVNSNIASLNAQRNLSTSQGSLTKSLQRLSSGLRINSAKDDAAGYAISERLSAQIRGSNQAVRNANDGISLAQTASGDLDQIAANLQRIRELAVQASNASNSASDRASLNNEASQLVQEIDRVAKNSSFNGIKLLDGSFAAQNFQVGANSSANDQIQVAAISSARTNSLGVGSGSSYSTVKTGSAVKAGVLAAGDLTINGKNVGATSADGVSFQGSASSGIAKAAAINAVSGDTGVTATVSATVVTGSAINAAGATTAIKAGAILINGVDIGAISASTGASAADQISERGNQIAAAINAKTNQTGVTAAFDVSTSAVTLTAADGRNITIGNNGGVDSAGVATAAVATNVSGLGAATTVGSTTAGDSNSAIAYAGTTYRSTVTLSSSTSTGITLGSGGGTGVGTATTSTTGLSGSVVAAGDIIVNGVALEGFTTDSADVNVQAAFNNVSAQTGVSASFVGGKLTLTSSVGGFSLQTKGTATESVIGFATGTNTFAGAGSSSASVTTGYKAATATAGAGVSSLDLTTAAGATAALDTIDAALNIVAKTQGALGAYQNRFESTIASLQTTSENLSASNSRIKDADFAQETASLSRAQVLQQAGTAMLAQANQLSQGVLSLLR